MLRQIIYENLGIILISTAALFLGLGIFISAQENPEPTPEQTDEVCRHIWITFDGESKEFQAIRRKMALSWYFAWFRTLNTPEDAL